MPVDRFIELYGIGAALPMYRPIAYKISKINKSRTQPRCSPTSTGSRQEAPTMEGLTMAQARP